MILVSVSVLAYPLVMTNLKTKIWVLPIRYLVQVKVIKQNYNWSLSETFITRHYGVYRLFVPSPFPNSIIDVSFSTVHSTVFYVVFYVGQLNLF